MGVRIRSPRDWYAGLVFLLFGLCAVVVGRNYPMGTAFQMGAGYFPLVLGSLLLVLGTIICARSLFVAGDKVEAIGLRPLILVLGAIGAFAASVDTLGIVVATMLMTAVGAAASPESRWREVIVVCVFLLALSVGVFAYGLGLPFKLLPF
ncbi:MAG TPA: tripartite tricarboxylate transporter TctB family protein [Burkholderiales bacterium]|nr:tripartite tricarboxylate transporter TctB family protein [Burkholderiales bacterium]